MLLLFRDQNHSIRIKNKNKKMMTFFEKFCPKKGHFQHFFQKSASAKMKPLYSLNFIPKIRKILRAVFEKKIKDLFDPFLTPFWPKKGSRGLFFKNRFSSLFYIYGPLTSCKILETSLEPIPVTLCY